MNKRELAQFERQITDLNGALAKLADDKDMLELIRIIRNPGWTTPAEFLFARGIATSMLQQAKVLADLKQNLVAGSRAVGIG